MLMIIVDDYIYGVPDPVWLLIGNTLHCSSLSIVMPTTEQTEL